MAVIQRFALQAMRRAVKMEMMNWNVDNKVTVTKTDRGKADEINQVIGFRDGPT